MGQEIAFELERGGGARANLLATKGRIRNKLVDAAAMKVGVDLGLVANLILEERKRRALVKKRKGEEKEEENGKGGKGGHAGNGIKKKKNMGEELDFLKNNLGIASAAMGGLSREEKERRRLGHLAGDDDSSDEDEDEEQKEIFVVTDETDELRNLPEDDRRAAFQAQYKIEVERQKKLFGLTSLDDDVWVMSGIVSEENKEDDEDESVAWEDG